MKNMKMYRKEAGLTQEKLAVLCNSDSVYIRQIELGKRFPSVTYIERIAGALNVAPYILFFDADSGNADTDSLLREKQTLEKTLIERVNREISNTLDEWLRNRKN